MSEGFGIMEEEYSYAVSAIITFVKMTSSNIRLLVRYGVRTIFGRILIIDCDTGTLCF